MSRRLIVLVSIVVLLGLVATIEALAAPQHSGHADITITQLKQRVAKLERRVALQTKINLTQTKINHSQIALNANFSSQIANLEAGSPTSLLTDMQIAFATADGSGGASSIAFCPAGQRIVGGGGGFVGQSYYNDHLIYSHVVPGSDAWAAAGDSPVGGRSFEVYAVCATLG
jgi:hypothetical protein